MVFPRGWAGVRSFVVPSCQRPVHRRRAPGHTPAHHAIIWSLCELHAGLRNTDLESAVFSLLSYVQLKTAEKGCSRKLESALSTRAFCKPVAAARNEGFGAKPGSPVQLRRRWNMNSCFHSNPVFRARRETYGIYFAVRAGGLLARNVQVLMMVFSPSRISVLAQTFWRPPGSRAHCLLTCFLGKGSQFDGAAPRRFRPTYAGADLGHPSGVVGRERVECKALSTFSLPVGRPCQS
jgi:hypothetical protein